jgi:transposase
MSKRYALSDAQWESIKNLLPGQAGQPGATAKNNRLFVDAVLYRYRAGIPWRDLPARFGDFRVVHTRHSRWSRTGVWQRVFEALAQDAGNEYAMIDSTIVRAHQHSAGAKGGIRLVLSSRNAPGQVRSQASGMLRCMLLAGLNAQSTPRPPGCPWRSWRHSVR